MSQLHRAAGHQSTRFRISNSFGVLFSLISFFSVFAPNTGFGQCTAENGTVQGIIFLDANFNGAIDAKDKLQYNIAVRLYNADGIITKTTYTDILGNYKFTGLANGDSYRVQFDLPFGFSYGPTGSHNLGDYRNVTIPQCEMHFGMTDPALFADADPKIAVACFSKGALNVNPTAKSIVSTNSLFNRYNSVASAITNKSQTGSVWGLAWKKSTQQLFSSAFIKQNAALGSAGPGGIYVTDMTNNATQLYINLSDLGINCGSTQGFQSTDCNYGNAVGRTGLGDLDISSDDKFLFVNNLFRNTIVVIPTVQANASNVYEIAVPNPSCSGGDYHVNGVKYKNGKLYVGVTCTADQSKLSADFAFHIYEIDILSNIPNLIFTTNFGGDYWTDNYTNEPAVSQWLSNIDFTDDGHMLIAIADRTGHRYCTQLNNQFGDLLILAKSGSAWVIESNAAVANLLGSGKDNKQGPGGGEFFGRDNWEIGPGYHPETTLGGIAVVPGSNQVMSAVFDPIYDTYAGGLHRYNTQNGILEGRIQLYANTNDQFGKASGLGDIEVLSSPAPIQIGNFVWNDANKNGLQDANEKGIPDLQISLYTESEELVATTLTDKNGYYGFNQNLKYATCYYLAIDDERFDVERGELNIDALPFTLSLTNKVAQISNLDALDNDASLISQLEIVKGFPGMRICTGGPGQNDYSFDIGFVQQSRDDSDLEKTYDLALIKRIKNISGDIVTFDIIVINQGSEAVQNISIVDYIPSGLGFVAANNPDWFMHNGNAKLLFSGQLASTESETFTITLQILPGATNATAVNIAEIASFEDLAGASVADLDSSPDENPSNDKGGVVNTVTDNQINGNGQDDEDDHDPEQVPVPSIEKIYDLALIKELKNTTSVKRGDQVTYQITIVNQGNQNVTNVEVVDYLPTGLDFLPAANVTWTQQNGILVNKTITSLLAGETKTLELTALVNSNATIDNTTNYSEISAFKTIDGNAIMDRDSKHDTQASNDPGGVPGTASDNSLNGNGVDDEDDHDGAMLPIYDLALIKEFNQTNPVRIGNTIQYDITIVNQGNMPVGAFEIIDHLPAGLVFNAALNPTWINTGNGTATYKHNSHIQPGAAISIVIKFQVTEQLVAQNTLNIAEISSLKNVAQISVKDLDSTPDAIKNNDAGGTPGTATDNILNGNGLLDEDDHDPAILPVFDLALIKKTIGEGMVKPGQDVEFEMHIVNQGNIIAKNIVVADFLPVGLTLSAFDQNGWVSQSNYLMKTITDEILPGQTKIIKIRTSINTNAQFQGALVNKSEIVSAQSNTGANFGILDFDSTPDAIASNDNGGVLGSATDDNLLDHGNTDEDDADPAVANFADLTLIKELASNASLVPGTDVLFRITVVNTGSVPVKNIRVSDYMPAGLSLSPNNTGWAANGNTASFTSAAVLAPGASREIVIALRVGQNVDKAGVNYAEISRFENEQGLDYSSKDIDSNPDANNTNDKITDINLNTYTLYYANPEVDEDDHDGAALPGVFDLALSKRLVGDASNIQPGDLVTFVIDIHNQGNIDANQVKIVDYIPTELSFVQAENPTWAIVNNALVNTTLPGIISAGSKKSIEIKFLVKESVVGKDILNYAEISSASGPAGMSISDFDSTPDNIKTNDKGAVLNTSTDNQLNGNGTDDEDDHDIADLHPDIYDLAIIKRTNLRSVTQGAIVDWSITIVNQGSLPATLFEIVDYLPQGIVSIDPEWSVKQDKPASYVYKTLSVANGELAPGGLAPNESIEISIKTQIEGNLRAGILVNRAEINYSENAKSMDDFDSTPDDDPTNDPGGIVGDPSDNAMDAEPFVDEDDSDPAYVVVRSIETGGCICLNNATTPFDGQYYDEILVVAPSNEHWFFASVVGAYNSNSLLPPAAPTPIIIGTAGDTLVETITSDGMSFYSFTLKHVDNIGYSIIVQNRFGDKLNIQNLCRYEQPKILDLENAVCPDEVADYRVQNHPGSTYEWTLSSGGVITTNPNLANIKVLWSGAPGSSHILTVTEFNKDFCFEPVPLTINIGVTNNTNQVSCLGDIQLSLDVNCEALITPQMLLVGGPYELEEFNVVLMDHYGVIIPNATATHNHIGKILTAKVMNGCTGNICWSKIKIEDKIKPTIVCVNDSIDCTRMQSYIGPFAYDNCDPSPTLTVLDEIIIDKTCDSVYSKWVVRKYQATDDSGNKSVICNDTIFLKKINLDSIIFPDSLTIQKNNALTCSQYPLDSLGAPSTSITGVPLYNGGKIHPNVDKYCDFIIRYKDYEVPRIGCVRKFMRVWEVFNWTCKGVLRARIYNQLIEIRDAQTPEIVCPHNITVSTQGQGECIANVAIAVPQATDDCSNEIRIDLVYPGGAILDFKGGNITLPVGVNNIIFRAYDECYNLDTCTYTITVVDKANPVAICDRETVVALDSSGYAYIPAKTFDDGSYDNCHLKSMTVRRMDNGAPCGLQNNVDGPYVEFCCDDLDSTVTVLFMVTDDEGNTNTCMVRVTVQDKILPQIWCPYPQVITCDVDLKTLDFTQFGEPTVAGNCNVIVTDTIIFDVSQCRVGYIDRVFTAKGSNGQASCTQTITVKNPNPFNGVIDWPNDFDVNSCDFDELHPDSLPDYLAYPRFNDDYCDLVGITYEDHVFNFVRGADACAKIIRRWKVIDWCTYDKATNSPLYKYDQVIKIYNTEGPEILTGCIDQKIEIFDTLCNGGNVTLIATADDDCTPVDQLRTEWHIDLHSDQTFEVNETGFGSLINASGFYPLGKHRIQYVFEDLCGNKTVCERTFEIINIKPPLAYCKHGLSVGLVAMDLNGDGILDNEMATVWAKDFDNGSYSPCGYPIAYSIGRDTSKHSITFDCNDIGVVVIDLCITDSNGRQSCCQTYIEVQDNNNEKICEEIFRPNCIRWPLDILIGTCNPNTSPQALNSFPIISECKCDTVTVTNSDAIVNNIPGICYRINRTWRVDFTCRPKVDSTFTYVQKIDVTTNFTLADVVWPVDTCRVSNCNGKTDTLSTGCTPRLNCTYNGNVMLRFVDRELPRLGGARIIERIWTTFSKCTGVEFNFRQIVKIEFPDGVMVMAPRDTTITDCRASLHPNQLGFPIKKGCPCDSITHTFTTDTLRNDPQVCYTLRRNWTTRVRCRPDIDTTIFTTQRVTLDVNLNPNDITFGPDTINIFRCNANLDPNIIGGRPTISGDFCGLVTSSFADVNVSGQTCSLVRRIWTVRNACSATQIFRDTQFIKVFNDMQIALKVPNDTTVNSQQGFCGANVTLPLAMLLNNCNTGVTITNNQTSNGANASKFYDAGMHLIIFMAMDTCGHVIKDTTKLTVVENIPPMLTCPRDTTVLCNSPIAPLSRFGNAVASDNCPGLVVVRDSTFNINICNIGTITRKWTATDASGNMAMCSQRITITNPDPLTQADITWPMDTIAVDECEAFHPDSLPNGRPIVNIGGATCAKVSINFVDTNLCMMVMRCDIKRTWRVIDSCQLNNQTGAGIFIFNQIIERQDTLDPMILGVADTTLYADSVTCNNFVNLNAFINECDSNLVTWTNDSPYGVNDEDDASGFYPAGITVVTFTVMDPCCNSATKVVTIEVIDTIPPQFLCRKVIKNINDQGFAQFCAQEFVLQESDNCTDSVNIMASFDINNFMDTCRIIVCDSLVGGNHLYPITVYFKDEAGNIDSCFSLLQTLDPDSICPNTLRGDVVGLIKNKSDKPIGFTNVQLTGSGNQTDITKNDGFYAFRRMPMGGTYHITPQKNDDPLNGVTTADIVAIQKHILGIKLFTNPYSYIAADINNSKKVSASDISELRKLILGKISDFPNNQSWRFVNAAYIFKDPQSPLEEIFAEKADIEYFNQNYRFDFTAVKIGDLDDSHNPKGLVQIKSGSRTNKLVTFNTSVIALPSDNLYEVTISKSKEDVLDGFQFELKIDAAKWQIADIKFVPNGILTSEHVNLALLSENIVRASWNGDSEEQILFKIILKSSSKVSNYDGMHFSSGQFVSEAYLQSGELAQITLKGSSEKQTTADQWIVLHQNIPNPFSQSTLVPFSLKEATFIDIFITDLTGKVIHKLSGNYAKGENSVDIKKSQLRGPGVYYYHIQSGNERVTKKMIMM